MTPGKKARRAVVAHMAALLCSLYAASSTETAEANGDTRTLNLYHSHTGESIQATFRVNGSYDPTVLAQLNHFLRDWRNNDETRMDPRLFDTIWEAYRTAGVSEPIVIYSAYRSPETNAMLRRRSHAVAEYSQHMLGKAMDTTVPGMSMERIREVGMRMQRGGVGWYPRENFVHLDVGGVRSWPRMSYDQLARLFPDGKTVHLASDGRTLPRYEEARLELASRGGVVDDTPQPQGGGFFAWLFGGGRDRAEEAVAARDVLPARARAMRPAPAPVQVASADPAAAPPPARMTAAERRAAAKAAKAAPALAAIASAETPEQQAAPSRTVVAALAPPPPVARAPEPAPVAARAAEPTPVPPPAPRDRAATEPDSTPAREAAKDREPSRDKVERPEFAAAPLPPARPGTLVAYADAPTPPARPAALVQLASLTPAEAAAPQPPVKPAAEAVSPLARAASLPVVITRGPKDREALPATALGYAATSEAAPRMSSAALGARKDAQIVSARLDRSNYKELTSDRPTAETPPASLLGRALTGLRQAARVIPDALAAAPSAGVKLAFGPGSLLDCTRFSKTAAAETPAAQAAVELGAKEVSISDASSRSAAR